MSVRFKSDERAAMNAAATASGKKLSDWVRDVLMKAAKRQ